VLLFFTVIHKMIFPSFSLSTNKEKQTKRRN